MNAVVGDTQKSDPSVAHRHYFQTEYWAEVKARLGWQPCAYDIEDRESGKDMLVLFKPLKDGMYAAYIPQGPEFGPCRENYGPYLESLSESIVDQMNSEVAFIRYDLPWESPYTDILDQSPAQEVPEERIREIRMNFGTRHWNFRKNARGHDCGGFLCH